MTPRRAALAAAVAALALVIAPERFLPTSPAPPRAPAMRDLWPDWEGPAQPMPAPLRRSTDPIWVSPSTDARQRTT